MGRISRSKTTKGDEKVNQAGNNKRYEDWEVIGGDENKD